MKRLEPERYLCDIDKQKAHEALDAVISGPTELNAQRLAEAVEVASDAWIRLHKLEAETLKRRHHAALN